MVSKNNWQYQQQRQAHRVPHYGLRKLSVGVASVLLSTTLYMGVSAHADTVVTPGEATTTVTTPSPSADKATSETTGSGANATSTDPASETLTSQATPDSAGATSEKPVDSTAGAKGVSETADSKVGSGTPVNDGQPADPQSTVNRLANTTGTTTTTVASDATRKTTLNTTITWTIHYVDETGNHLQPDSVVSHDYTRTDIGDQMGNWSYVPNSVKVTGTPNAGSHIDNPDFKFDQIEGKATFDYASWYAAAASIDGYTPDYSSVVITDQLPKNPEGLHATTIVDSGKHECTFVYTQRPKTVTINYVNDDDNENVVKTDSVNGKPNTEVTITPNLPSGYMLTPGKDVPSKYTMTDGDNQVVTIHVQKQLVDVSDTDPQAKQTRTITLHYVYDGGSKDGQKAFDDAVLDVYYHRTATFNRSTNQTTYGDWTWDNSQGDTSTPGYHVVSGKWTNLPQSWANVTADVPNIKGYHADLGQNDPTNTNHVPANTWVFPTYNNRAGAGVSDSNKGATAYLDGYGYEVSPTHTIKYVPNQTTVTVNYVDDDNNKANVGSQHWDGTIGQHIDLTLTPPANYVLSPGWANPSSYDFDGVNSSWFTVHVKHATQDVTATQPEDQVNKTETLTRKHLYGPGPHEGENFGDPDIVEVPWHRTATKDLVTDKISFGDWHVVWDKVKQLSGATKMWGDSEHNWVNGGLIAGHSGYSYLGVGAKTEAITTDGTVSGHGWYWTGEQDIEKHPTIVQYYGREKVGVPVNYVDFDTNQQLTTKWLTGDDYLDGNTITFNKGDLTDWGTSINKKYQLYAGQTLPTTYKIDTVSNNGNLTPITVYVVQPRTVQFTFADNDSTVNGQHPQVGYAVSVTGVTGSTTPVNLMIPAGYKLVDGQQLPTTYTFVKGKQNQVILLTHQHVTVQSDAPKTTTDVLPDNLGKNYPSGVAKDDLSKTVTRKVTITTPDGKSTVTNQTVTFTRNATVDEVTGNVTYGSWSEDGKHEFATVDVPSIPGYTATGDVPSLTVTPDSKDTNVTINYTAKDQTTQVVFVDDDDNGRTVDYEDIHGKVGETQKLTDLPENYELANGQSDTITFTANTPSETTVHLKHKIVTKQLKINVYFGLERLIKGTYNINQNGATYLPWMSNDELNSGEYGYGSIYKNIGSVTGSVQYDLVSGEVVKVNNGETFKFDDTILSNYPLDIDVANSGSLTGSPDVINHTFADMLNEDTYSNLSYKSYASVDLTKDLLANEELLNYLRIYKKNLVPAVLDNGKQHGSDYEINMAKTDSPFLISFNDLFKNNYSDHYDIEKNDDGSLKETAMLTLPIVYQAYTSKTVTRTINVTSPDKTVKTIKQAAEINQNVGLDFDHQYPYLHKGDAYATDNNWTAYKVPTVDGYTASQNAVEAVAVNGDTTDQTVNISYTANKQSVNVNYVDVNDGNKVIHTTTVNGVTDGDSTVPSELPAGYKLVDGQSVPKTVHFNANNDDINIKVQHSTVTVTPDSPKTPIDKLPDNPGKSYPSGVSESDLNKTITRTIKITRPDGTVTNKVQTVKLTRNADVDEVTGEVKYGAWTTGQWNAYDVPSVSGYTSSQNNVPATEVTSNTTDQTVEVSYTPNKQSTTIKYVDDKGQTIHTTTVDGVTDQKVKVPSEVPAGWKITKGEVPSELTFDADGHEPIEVTVDHQHVTVDPDYPQNNGTKLPDNPANTFNGVEANDLNKIITRTIKVTTPDGKSTTTKQTVKLTRTADVDEVTGEVTYGNWTTGQWDDYEVPALKGYTASQTSVETTPVDENTKDQTVEVSYTPNKQSTTIKYVDDKGQTIHTTTVDGVTDQKVKVPSEVPAGWKITKGEVPSELTFGVDGHESIEVTVDHQHVTVDPDHPQNNGIKLPDNPAKTFNGVEVNDLNKTITRTIDVTTPDGKSTTTNQEAKLTRTADVDEVTGEVTYGKWTTGEWTAYNVPSVTGYTPSQTAVAKESVTATSNDTTVEVTYQPMQHQIRVEYVDDDDHGKVVKTDQVPGKTDQTITVTPSAPVNYDLVDNGSRTYTVTSDDAQAVQIHVKHHQVTTSESKTVTRTVNVHTPHDGAKVVKQTAELTRNVTTDQVTGDKTYGDWTTGQWESYTPEAIPGYTPSTNEVLKTNVDGNSKNQTVDVTYTADAQKVEIVYVDDTKGGAVVKTDQVAGKTDETVKVTPDVPAGYELVGKVPGDYTMTAGGHQTITVHLVHQMKTVSESKTVTRTINVHTPHDGARTIKQTAELTRDVTTDQVTGEKTYGDWSTAEWDRYAVPAIAGYVPSVEQVAQQVVNGTTTDQTIDVIYSSGEHTTHINYVDGDGNIVHTTTIKGQTDGTAQVPNETPAGWTVVGEPVPTELAFGPDGHSDVTVTVDHQHVTVTPDQPKTPTDKLPDNPAKMYPNGVGNDNLNKTITRTIKIVMPDGQTKTVAQTAHLTRTADVDEVTGEVTYGKWTTGEWSNYDVPTVPGYTPSQSEVPAQTVSFGDNDVVKTVTYKANTQKLKVVFIDDTTGKTLNTIEKAGLSDTDSGYNTKADISDYAAKHYDLVSDGTNGQNLVFDHDDGKDQHYEVHLVHATHPIDEQVSTKQTIHYQLVDGTKVFDDHTAQVDFSRDGYNDEVTNENHWNKWTPSDFQTFSKVVSPVKSGYTPDKASVAAVDVHTGDKNVEETVIYSPDKQVMTINYIDDVTGKTLSTKQITGFSDASANYNTKSSINSYVAGHYKLVSDDTNSDNLVFDHDDSIDQVYNVHLTHSYQKVDDHKSVNETVHYIYDDGQTARPDYKAPAINFSRTGTKDLVTSNIVWNAWTPAEQSFDQVTTPAISGYTPDVEVVPSVNVSHGSDDLERTVIYHADDQTILVNYIDDDTHSTLKTDTVIGKTAQKSNYTTKKSIDGYIADHYKLVSDDTNDNELVFDSDSTKAQVYNVHLKHAHQNVSDSALVNETIHYVYADGSKARNDYHAPVISFKRTGDKDLVTNAIVWNDWIPASQDFKTVDSPVIDGYTPSQKTISNITVKPGDKDIDQTVVYAPDTQSIVVNYIDDVTGKTLKTDTLTGKSDRASDYTTKNNINGYENQHYVLVSDDTQGKTLTFDHDDKATQVYNVHLSHQTELASQSRTVHETINYVYADGSKASDTVTANPLTFTQTGVKDLVTNVIAWNDDWTSKQTFAEVKSPEITGYTASRTSVGPITVDHNSSDIHQTVIYTANDQTARINYIDDVTGKTLETDSANGKFGDQINFGHDVDTQIKVFEGQGYKFKSNSFNGQKYQADNSQNEFEIHFTHGTQNVSRTNKVTETVKYQFADGRQAQKDHVQTVEFTQHGVQDLVTKTTVWTPSDPQTFASVDTPHITGYTSDIQNVPAATVNFGDEDIVKTVTYKANQQKLDVVFIDDVTGQVLKTANKIGLSDTDSGYNTKADISDYAAKHYDLVSDGTNGKNLMFDHDDNTDQHYEVHLTHHKSDTSRQSTVNETIHYVYENSKQAADDYVAKPIAFTQTGVKDLVTGDTDWNGQWTSDQEFKAVDSPEITGYTPSQKTVDAIKVSHDTSDIKRVVTYVANNQVAKITYIDDVTGKALATDEVSGKFGSRVDYNALARINSFEKQGYQLKTNGFDQPSYQADDTKNQFEIRLMHQLNKTSRESTVTRTISYVDSITGLTLHQPIIQTLKFIEDGVTDLVTNETTWQTASRQQFVSVKVPEIKGYASELSVVEPAEVGFGDANIETTVKYKKLDVTNTISYVDSQGKVIKTDTVSGQSGTEIKLDVPSGYHLVDNQTKVTISKNNSTQTVKITKDNSANKIARHLPQTGNQRETGLVALGLATGLLGLVVLRKKRN